ncbi:MAG: EVE domain-containing protein [Chromatiales bacterium]|nr:EVE domain-containing protein [Chromatiales bacterium]MDH4012516.1 EVE domain-containing protein [Chromatiales bacterium]PLX55331.1 MAG: EVE domain-containing protein [Chromatiales bacterium]
MKFWLMKSEPEEFGIEDLKRVRTEPWDGVRNYQARNMMRDEMKKGDKVFFYHSNCDEPGVYGVMRIKREAYPDHTAFDPDDKHYDPKSDPDNPRWFMVDVGYVRKFKQPVTLRTMREYTETELRDLALLRRGNRLSIMPVTPAQWEFILGLAK